MKREPLDGYSCSAVDLVTSAKFGDAYQIVLTKVLRCRVFHKNGDAYQIVLTKVLRYRVFHKKTRSLPHVCRTIVCRTNVAVKYEIHVFFLYTLRANLAVFKVSEQERMDVAGIGRVFISSLFLSR